MTGTFATESTRRLDWRAAIWAGIGAGFTFMMLEMLLVQFFGPGSMWGPPRMIAAIAMGRAVLPPPDTFDATIFLVAIIIHLLLALIYSFVFAWIVSRWDLQVSGASISGALFGLAIYAINFYGFTAVLPWFVEARGWIAILSHAVFGLVLGTVYQALKRR